MNSEKTEVSRFYAYVQARYPENWDLPRLLVRHLHDHRLRTTVPCTQNDGRLTTVLTAGSAAYNLLVISAVRIMSVPEGETKSVTDFGVFVFTAIFSLWAYLWMLIVYVVWTPDQVTIVEALLTLAYLPVMVLSAYKINTWGVSEEQEISADGGNEDEDGCDASPIGTFDVICFCASG